VRQLAAREGRDCAILDRRRAGQPELEAAGDLGVQAVLRQQLLRLNSLPSARLCEVGVVRPRLLLSDCRRACGVTREPGVRPAGGH